MTDMSPPPLRVSSNALARERDSLLLRLLQHHPATAGMLVDLGRFRTKKKASKRLHRLACRKQIRCVGTVSLKRGRPEHVYGRGGWKGDNLWHEVQLTRVCLKVHAEEVRRGFGLADSYLRLDAELWIRGECYYLEMDCGTISYPEVVRKRFAKYRSAQDLVVWARSSETHGGARFARSP